MPISPPAANSAEQPRWDPWMLWDGERYHLYYLSGQVDQAPWWKISWICGAQSIDGCQWSHLGQVLAPLKNEGWESGRIFAGSTYQNNSAEGSKEDKYYLFYSAAGKDDIANEAIGLATSADGVNWQRTQQPLLSWKDAVDIVTPMGVGYAGRCNWAGHLHWRDPYVVKVPGEKMPEENKYYLYFCTSLTDAERYQGGLGVAIADQLDGPYQLLPPAAGPGISTTGSTAGSTEGSDLWPFYHLERPQVVAAWGRYHLFFSCFKESVNPLWLRTVGEDNVSDSTLYWYVADQPTGPFRPVSDLPVVPGSESTGLYGTTFFPELGDWGPLAQAAASNLDKIEMRVLGWYYQDFRLAIANEFSAVWTQQQLTIVKNNVD